MLAIESFAWLVYKVAAGGKCKTAASRAANVDSSEDDDGWGGSGGSDGNDARKKGMKRTLCVWMRVLSTTKWLCLTSQWSVVVDVVLLLW